MKPSFQDQLAAFINSLDPAHQATARQQIAGVLDSGAVTYPAWLALIADPQAGREIRLTACWVIGLIGNQRAFSVFLRAFQEPDPIMRARVAGSLAHLRSRVKPGTRIDAVDPLIQAFQTDPDLNVRLQSAFALRAFGDPRAAGPLITVLSNPDEPVPLRDLAAEVLAYIPDARAVTPLVAALQDPDERIRFSAAYTLGALNGFLAPADLQPAIAPLIAALRDPVHKIRIEAAHALGRLGDPIALAELEKLAATAEGGLNEDESVAQAARDAITTIHTYSERNQEGSSN